MLLNQKREIQEVFEQILGASLDFKITPNQEEEDTKKEFINLVEMFEELWKRQENFKQMFKIDFETYDDKFFRLIDQLIHFGFATPAAEAILFYVYSRYDEEGNLNVFMDPDGKKYEFKTPDDLWDYMLIVTEQLFNNDEMLDL